VEVNLGLKIRKSAFQNTFLAFYPTCNRSKELYTKVGQMFRKGWSHLLKCYSWHRQCFILSVEDRYMPWDCRKEPSWPIRYITKVTRACRLTVLIFTLLDVSIVHASSFKVECENFTEFW